MRRDKENEYFSDGLAEEIINSLVQISGLKVTARTSAFAFRVRCRIGVLSVLISYPVPGCLSRALTAFPRFHPTSRELLSIPGCGRGPSRSRCSTLRGCLNPG